MCLYCIYKVNRLLLLLPLGILAVFPVGDTIWTMDNNMLLSMGYDSIQLSIKLPENSDINVIISSPYQAFAVIGKYLKMIYCVIMICDILETLKPNIILPDYASYKVAAIGDAVMLMCLAHGRSTISYHWEYHINESDTWVTASADMDSGLLILSSVTKDNEGIYRCVACDCYSCTYSINTTAIDVIGKEISNASFV